MICPAEITLVNRVRENKNKKERGHGQSGEQVPFVGEILSPRKD